MAEKRVSVRLAAVGGRQVRAELEGVGEAGSRGFGRLSREMEAANARLAAFSRASWVLSWPSSRYRTMSTFGGSALAVGMLVKRRAVAKYVLQGLKLTCGKCGYPTVGLGDARVCPECGSELPA